MSAYLRGAALGYSFSVRADEELARGVLSVARRLKAALDNDEHYPQEELRTVLSELQPLVDNLIHSVHDRNGL